MAENNSNKGTRQFMMDYNANVLYPYTLLDCILDGDVNENFDEGKSVVSGIEAIMNKLVSSKSLLLGNDKLKDKTISVLGLANIDSSDGSNNTNTFVQLDNIKTYPNNNLSFLGCDGYFKTLTTSAEGLGEIKNVGSDPISVQTSLQISNGSIISNENNQVLNLQTKVTLNLDNKYFDASNGGGSIKVKYADKAANLSDASIGSITTPIYYNGSKGSFETCTNITCKADNIWFDNIGESNDIVPGFKNIGSPGFSSVLDASLVYMPFYIEGCIGDSSVNPKARRLILKDVDSNINNTGLLTLARYNNLEVDKLYFPSSINNKKSTYVVAYDASDPKAVVKWKEYIASLNLDYSYFSSSSSKESDKLKTETPCYLIGNPFNKVDENTQLPYSIDSAACATNGSIGIYFKGMKLYQTSDERLKTFTSPIDINFDNLLEIKKGEFYWNDDPDKTPDLGVSAQSLEAIYPQIVDDVDGTKTVSYNRLGVIALAAIDKLHLRIKELEKEVKNLKKELKK